MPTDPLLTLAAKMRRGEIPLSMAELYYAVGEGGEQYRHAMIHAGATGIHHADQSVEPCDNNRWGCTIASHFAPITTCPTCGERFE